MTNQKSRHLRNPIVGDKVLLRTPTSKDYAEFIALNRASRGFHRGLVSPPTTPEQFAAFLKRSDTETSICVFICLVTDGSLIGAMSLSQIFRGGFQNAYLGYSGFRKEGYSPRYLKVSGRWQDHERWAILAEDWQARPGTTTKLI